MKGGKRPGAGRPAGARNRKTSETQAAIEQSGLTPLDYMIGVMRNEKNDQRTRLEAAHHAAPYVHARLSATDLTLIGEEEQSPEEIQAKLRMLIGKADPAFLSQIKGEPSSLSEKGPKPSEE